MAILFLILKILGYILLTVLSLFALILLIVIVVCVTPIRYNAEISKNEKLKIIVKATWLFRIVRVNYKLGEPVSIKILFFNVSEKKKNKSPDDEPDEQPFDLNESIGEKIDDKTYNNVESADDKNEKSISKDEDLSSISEVVTDTTENTYSADDTEQFCSDELEYIDDTEPEKKKSKKEKKPKKPKKEKDKDKPSAIKQTIKNIIEYPYKERLIKTVLKLFKGLFKAIKPKSIKLNILFGTGDPALTGKLLGALYAFAGTVNADVTAKGDFEQATIEGDIKIKGRLIIGQFIYVLIRFVISKPIWLIVKKYLKGRKSK